MTSPVEKAVEAFVRAADERDPVARAALLESCFAPDGRIVARSREIRGRAAVSAEFEKLFADSTFARIRMTSVIEAAGTTFRYFSAVERRDGSSVEFFDAGEIDASGRIVLILTFVGRLRDA